jgi:hypothetical protein
MPRHNKPRRRLWLVGLQAGSVAFLLIGFVLVGKSTIEVAKVQHATTDSLSWSSGGFLLLLIGSLTNSLCKGCKPGLSNSVKPED